MVFRGQDLGTSGVNCYFQALFVDKAKEYVSVCTFVTYILIYMSIYPIPRFPPFACLQIPSFSVRNLASVILNIHTYLINPPIYNQSSAFAAST